MVSFLLNITKTTVLNIKTNKHLFLMSVATISIAFSVLGLFFLLLVNLNTLLYTWDKNVQLIVYLDDGISKANNKKLENLFESNNKINSVIFISRIQAWESFKNTFSGKSKFVMSMNVNPLPASYTLKFREGLDRLKNIREFSKALKKQEGVESLEYGEKWISGFEKFMLFFRILIITFGAILFAGMILIISSTIKLSIYSRKDEIDLMLLLGATQQFIKAPLLFEGLLQGTVSSLFALVTVKLVHVYIGFQFHGSLESIFRGVEFMYLTDPLIWSMIIAGVFIGMLGSLISVNQFLNARARR